MCNQRIINKWLAITVLTAFGLFSAGGVWAQAANFPGAGTYTSIQIVKHSWYIDGADANGHAINQAANPNKTWKIRAAPNNGHGAGFFNIINQTDGRCLVVGDGVYEMGKGATSSAGYAVELTNCDYTNDHTQWIVEDNGIYVQFRSNGFVASFANTCVQENDLIGGVDIWVRNWVACGAANGAVQIKLNGYSPTPAESPAIFRKEMY